MKGYFMNDDGSLMYGSYEERAQVWDHLVAEKQKRRKENAAEWIGVIVTCGVSFLCISTFATAYEGLISWGWFAFAICISLIVLFIYGFIRATREYHDYME